VRKPEGPWTLAAKLLALAGCSCCLLAGGCRLAPGGESARGESSEQMHGYHLVNHLGLAVRLRMKRCAHVQRRARHLEEVSP
jgi:hypothetical protein